ncbi:MAG: hypothetical protein IT258_19120 [Saprospiraceae bacterium]|nr:hypothetical protein [Saprospiraceae bacterium]
MKKLYFSSVLFLCFFCNVIAQEVTVVEDTDNFSWTYQGADYKLPTQILESEVIKIEESVAARTCFCVVSYDNLTNKPHRTGECLDLTGVVNTTYSTMSQNNRNKCNNKCTMAAAALTSAQKQSIANCACAANKGTGTIITAFSALSTADYLTAQQIGVLTNSPTVTQTTCKCPSGWLANDTNVDGGNTSDGKCKKGVCSPIGVTPLPPNGTPIGSSWGFTWGNAIYAWGTTANGGAPTCNTVVISPAVCTLK